MRLIVFFSLPFVLVSLSASITATAQDSAKSIPYDPKVICFQQHRIDSIFQYVKKKKEVSSFFNAGVLENAALYKSRIDLMRRGLTNHKAMTVERSAEVWTSMLPQYDERYYFEMKDGRVIYVSLGFTAVSKFAGWDKVLNFTVKHWTPEQLKEYREGDGTYVAEGEWIASQTVTKVKIDTAVCERK